MSLRFLAILCFLACSLATRIPAQDKPVHGIPGLESLLANSQGRGTRENPFLISIPQGEYHLYRDQCPQEELYVSNALQINPKYVGLALRNLKNVVIDFNDSELLIHGRLLPIVFENCENCTLKNLHIDSTSPLIQQLTIIQNNENGIVVRPADWVRYRIQKNQLIFVCDQWESICLDGMAYNPETKHVLCNVPGFSANLTGVQQQPDGTLLCPQWKDDRLVPGTVVILRPDSCIQACMMLYHNTDTTLENIKIHYTSSKAITAQYCENLHYNGVSVCLRGDDDPRCFTGNADACHFSGCKGKIIVENGLFESMMDDAINVHGIYMKVTKRLNSRTIEVTFPQQGAWGLEWAAPGDVLQFIHSRRMDLYPGTWTISTIKSVDKPTYFGAKTFEIEVSEDLPDFVAADGLCGVENLTRTAEVVYRNNIIRNNRARGCLFSTPKSILVENCLFDHVSGTGILFCGDCNFWYESGPCRNVVVRNNRFVNCMTSFYQYCNAVISIFPEIPDFENQTGFYYGGHEKSFIFENNVFDCFDAPVLYARSVDGLIFRNNIIRHNTDFPRISPITVPFFLERARRVRIYDNDLDTDFDPNRDVKTNLVPVDMLRFDDAEPFPTKK